MASYTSSFSNFASLAVRTNHSELTVAKLKFLNSSDLVTCPRTYNIGYMTPCVQHQNFLNEVTKFKIVPLVYTVLNTDVLDLGLLLELEGPMWCLLVL